MQARLDAGEEGALVREMVARAGIVDRPVEPLRAAVDEAEGEPAQFGNPGRAADDFVRDGDGHGDGLFGWISRMEIL